MGNLEKDKGNYFGVYLFVLPENFGEVRFGPSNLMLWRGEKVSVPIEELQEKWVESADILYIGCSASKTVQERVRRDHIPFWKGEKQTPAFGGRVIGQIQNFENLQVWYLRCENPLKMKKDLLKEFKKQNEVLPFANWKD